MMTVKRGAIYSKYCMLLVSRRVPSLHTAAGARTAVCSSFLCCFSLAKVKLSRIESPFSPVLIFSLCINSSTGLKVPQEVAVSPPPPSPSSLPTNRPEYFQRDANDICFILPSERPQSVGFKKARQLVPNIFMNNRLCVSLQFFFFSQRH